MIFYDQFNFRSIEAFFWTFFMTRYKYRPIEPIFEIFLNIKKPPMSKHGTVNRVTALQKGDSPLSGLK